MTTRCRRVSTARLVFLIFALAGCAEIAYQHMNDPKRDTWQRPKEIIERLTIQPGARVADLGAGGGYFTWHLAAAVGPEGHVYAVDINETGLRMIEKERTARGVSNVTTIRAESHDAKLPGPVDLVFSCDTYHHMSERVGYFRSLARSLKPQGRVAILDFHPGWLGHGTAKSDVQREMEAAGYRLLADYDLIQNQHFQIFAPTPS